MLLPFSCAADTSTSQAPLLSLLHGLEEASTGLVHTKAGRPEMGFLLPLHYTGYFWMRGRAHENGNHERRQCSAKKREGFLKTSVVLVVSLLLYLERLLCHEIVYVCMRNSAQLFFFISLRAKVINTLQ